MTTRACDHADACERRIEAVKAGRFELGTNGWRWLDAITPDAEWMKCPWCDRPLPTADTVKRRVYGPLWRQRQADGAECAPTFDEETDRDATP